jgi:hypothetical protein
MGGVKVVTAAVEGVATRRDADRFVMTGYTA